MNTLIPALLNRRRWATVSAGLVCGVAVAQTTSTPPAQQLEQQPVQLTEFVVQTDQDRGYSSSNTAALRLNTEIKKLPLPVTVITREFIDDIDRGDVDSILSYTAAVNNDQDGNNSSGFIRGMDSGTGEAAVRNNSNFRGFMDTSAVERVEILKGPAGLLHGVARPGGQVNVIGIRAQRRERTRFEAQYGSYGSHRFRADVNRPVGDKLAVRAVYQYRDDQMKWESTSFVTRAYNFNALYRPWRRGEIEFDFQHVNRDEYGATGRITGRSVVEWDRGTPNSAKIPLFMALGIGEEENVIDDSWIRERHHTIPTLTWRQTWSDNFDTSVLLNHQWRSQHHDQFQAAGTNYQATVPTINYAWQSDRGDEIRTWEIQLQALYRFKVFGVPNRVSAYLREQEFNGDFYRHQEADRDANGNIIYLSSGAARRKIYTANLADLLRNPIGKPANLTLDRFIQKRSSTSYGQVGNLMHQAEISTRIGMFNTLAGLNFVRSGPRGPSYNINDRQVRAVTTGSENQDSLFSYGLVYSPRPNLQFWAANVNSVAGLGIARNSFGDEYPLVQDRNREVGVRTQLMNDRVHVFASYFHQTQFNRRIFNPALPNANTEDINGRRPRDPGFDPNNLAPDTPLGENEPTGEYLSKGFDFELSLNLSQNFTAKIEYTYVDAAIAFDHNRANIGRRENGATYNTLAGAGRYRFANGALKGFWIGAGYRFTTDRFRRDNLNGIGNLEFTIPGARRIDMFMGYPLRVGNRTLALRLNLDNVLRDTVYTGIRPVVHRPFEIDGDITWRFTLDYSF